MIIDVIVINARLFSLHLRATHSAKYAYVISHARHGRTLRSIFFLEMYKNGGTYGLGKQLIRHVY